MGKNTKKEEMPAAHADAHEGCGCDNSCHCKSAGGNCNDQNGCDCKNTSESATDSLTTEEKFLEIQDKYLRLIAEFDNFRKRNARERIEMAVFAGEDIIKGLLSVVDDFERALKSVETMNNAESLVEGVKLIYQKLLDYLKSKGLQEIDTTDGDFNTDLHDAVTKFPAASPEQKGKIIDVIQKGYKLHDKVVRFAKVVVGE